MISVRRARREDAPDLLRLIDALADYEKLEPPDAGARERLLVDGFDRDPPRFEAYLAEEEETGAAVGYAIVFTTYSSFLARPTLYIEDIFVVPEARCRGAASALFAHLAREALARDCGRMEWVVLDWNTLAQGFYQRRGARHMSDWQHYRLTREDLERLAGSGGAPASSAAPSKRKGDG